MVKGKQKSYSWIYVKAMEDNLKLPYKGTTFRVKLGRWYVHYLKDFKLKLDEGYFNP